MTENDLELLALTWFQDSGWEYSCGPDIAPDMGAIKTEANKPHHSPNDHFDRFEAQMLMMITTALISYAASQIEETAA